jgi:hypothetical protein
LGRHGGALHHLRAAASNEGVSLLRPPPSRPRIAH